VQYSWDAAMRCSTSTRPKAGDTSRGVDSGWIHSRMKSFFSDQDECQDGVVWPDH
jgi:hypothetical protein